MGLVYDTLSPIFNKKQTTLKPFLMEKYLPNESIVDSPFDGHPSGILASLSHALLGTHPGAAGVERCEIGKLWDFSVSEERKKERASL